MHCVHHLYQQQFISQEHINCNIQDVSTKTDEKNFKSDAVSAFNICHEKNMLILQMTRQSSEIIFKKQKGKHN